MGSVIFYDNISRLNHGILLKNLYIYLRFSKQSIEFINFLKINGIISNYITKNERYIIVFFKFSSLGFSFRRFVIDRKITLWRWFRFKRLITFTSLFSKRYKKHHLFNLVFYTSKGFLFFETAYWLGIGGRYVGYIKY